MTSNDVHRIIQNKLTKNAKLPGRANETHKWVHPQNNLYKLHLQLEETKEKAIARQSKPYTACVTQCQCNNEHRTAQSRTP